MDLLDKILENLTYDTVTDTELTVLLSGTPASRYNQIKRALANGKLIHLRRGLYQLAKRYQRRPPNAFEVAQKIYGPSYVSFESALSHHGLIPEAVYGVTSACLKRSRTFETPIGVYSFSQVPRRIFYMGVERVEKERAVYLMATPAKALADYVFCRHQTWPGTGELLESLRIEKSELKINPIEIELLAKEYRTARVAHMLEGLRKMQSDEH
ncbi:MAG: hypothetical protein C5B49_02460 [Bdellovibrio sp.]|nr:MAG: hypothetical protein C5B49_02460 [Bdellovibrio sp.]